MIDEDHDKITIMQTDIQYIKDAIARIENSIETNREESKMAAIKYADQKVISTFRDIGSKMFAKKYVQTIIVPAFSFVLGVFGYMIFELAQK